MGENEVHKGTAWGLWQPYLRITPEVKYWFSAKRHRSQESCAMFVKEPGIPRGMGGKKKKKAANLTTLHIKLWVVSGSLPPAPPPVTLFMPHGTKNGVFNCNFSAHRGVFKASSRRWAHAECAHFKTDERHQKQAAPSLQGRNGEHACLIRSSISCPRWHPSCCTMADISQSFTPTQTSRAWKLRWCLWLLSRLNNSPSFLKAGFSCGGGWSPAVSVQPAPKDTVKMQQHISHSACVYTWNRVSSGHQHLIFSCCQPVPLVEGKQHHELE